MIDSPLLKNVTVPGRDTTIPAAAYTLSTADHTSFEILVNPADGDGITENIANRTFSFPYPFALLPLLARPGGRVLDLGAHIGTFSLLAARLGYEVTSVEASPRNVALLQASAEHNHFQNLRVISAAVSDSAGTLDFIEGGPYGLVANPYYDVPLVSVPALPVDEILADISWDGVDFVKMDVEGSEVKAIAGMQKLLSRADAPPILFESNGHTLHYFNQTPNRLLEALEAFGYNCYLVEPGRLIPLAAAETLFSCTVDCLAVKTPLSSLPDWQITAPLTYEMRIDHILAMAAFPHPHLRSYISRTLRDAGFDILRDRRVLWALERLTSDDDAEVRADAAWFLLDRRRLSLTPTYKMLALLQRYLARLLNLWQRLRLEKFMQG
jgi:FkbM family methyltransferase